MSVEWTFNRGDCFHWKPFGINLRLVEIEGWFGVFVETKNGSLVNGAERYEWPLDQNVLQGLHITKINRPTL